MIQWLFSLSKPLLKGIVSSQNLNHILRGTSSSIEEIISVMRKFEVMFKLDEERHLIPSLLPLDEANPFIIMPQSAPHISNDTSWGLTELRVGPPAPISSQPDILIRYLCLPFTPNGFFPRLIAQVMNSDLATQIQASLTAGPLDSAHLLNQVHWEAWRTGMSLVWNHMEILRIAPLSWPLPHSNGAAIISSLPLPEERETLQGMEIMVAVLPEDRTLCCPILPPDQPHDSDSCSCNKSRCMATWILQKVTDLAEIVMEDWYEVFGFRRNLNNLLSCMTSPCPHCFMACHDPKKVTSSENGARSEPGRKIYMFTLPYCSLNSEGRIACPDHGVLEVAQVAPDLVFADFAPAALIPNKDVKLLERLGEGGFAKVYQGLLTKGTEQMKVAVKELAPSRNPTDLQIPELEPEKRSWAVYHEASVEARMMYQLNHPHILTLMGITLHPIRLVLELAREDLASTVVRYQKKNKRFSRRTLRATLTQIADAMAYLHSRNILFRDLKPGNVLVWDFPLPREQWNPDAQILVKVADYGISKQISPQGIHSKAGTPQYLPPEVLLNSEHEAASLKVDVYSFGMVMYYLFSFGNPFGSSLLVGSQLRHSRRPELQTKHWPNSVQMVELMAWCWSDKPRHRPSFEQILSILRGETIYSLVGGLPLGDVEEVHAAAVKTIAIPHRRHSSTFSPPASVQGQGQSCLRLSSIIPARACGIGMGTGIEVWYGTIKGTLKMVRYHSTGTFVKAITHNSTKYISSIVIVSSNVWVGTIGEGLWVYDSVSRQLLAMWGETEEEEVYQLIQVESTVLALTGSGMYLFTAELSDSSQTVTILDPLLHRPCSETQNTVGVYIPRMSDVTSPEVWACAQKGEWVQVLYPNDLSVRVEVEIPSNQNKKIRHMVTTVVGEKCCVFLADWHMLLKYEVKSRQRAGSVDCHAAIWRECHSTHIETQLKQAQVTSLVAGDDGVLYVGNKVGKILLVKTDTLEVISRLDAYEGSVRSLKMVPMSEAFSRMISSFESTYSLRGQMSTTPSSSSIDSVFSPSPLSSTLATPTSSEQHSVLLSFGVGYKGVVAGATNHPDGFLLPHGLTQCPCCTHFLTQPRPVPSSTHLLLWSREAHPHGGDVDGREGDHLDGSSE
jgi:serine/threonine protein kinase